MPKNTLSDVNPDSESKGKDFIENGNKKKDKYDFIHYNLVPVTEDVSRNNPVAADIFHPLLSGIRISGFV